MLIKNIRQVIEGQYPMKSTIVNSTLDTIKTAYNCLLLLPAVYSGEPILLKEF
jgi:hypothetical protein